MTSIDDIYKVFAEWPIGQPMVVTVIRLTDKKLFEIIPAEAK